jgi:RNA recognition motif-containing protein
MCDPMTKKSKCYGFLKFSDYQESLDAVKEMNGYSLFGKEIKISQVNLN